MWAIQKLQKFSCLLRCYLPSDFIFGTFIDTDEVRSLAPIAMVMLPEAPAYEAFGALATFEWKAGSPFLNGFCCFASKKYNYLNARLIKLPLPRKKSE